MSLALENILNTQSNCLPGMVLSHHGLTKRTIGLSLIFLVAAIWIVTRYNTHDVVQALPRIGMHIVN